MIKPHVLEMLKQKITVGIIITDDIKNEEYKEAILNEN